MRKRLVIAAIAFIAVAAVAAAQLASASSKPSPPSTANIYARVGGQQTPIKVGSVIAQLSKGPNGTCVVGTPVGVGAEVPPGQAAPRISVAMNSDCQMIVSAIDPGTSNASPARPTQGSFSQPSPPGP